MIKTPPSFSQTSQLATAISQAASEASDQNGVAGNVNVMNDTPGMAAPSPSTTADPYLVALRDAQAHAAEIARITGLPLGHITSVHQQAPPPQYTTQNRVMLEVDYGPDLSVVGVSSLAATAPYNQSTNQGLRIYVGGYGNSADDARASLNAYESAVRKAAARFGITSAELQIVGGAVNSGQ
ncbi:MAG TPA: hypothetical protein VKT51_07135 [Candidatus Eremiobacteraceae bacterium]|nr:hypothetical protein [Candidatus Eremiobacteraceae bacterium]